MAVTSTASIGRRIRQARITLGLSASALGQKIGTDKGTVSRMERGKAGISAERLQRISAALGRPVEDLLAHDSGRRAATG